jgi:hypothetical protein
MSGNSQNQRTGNHPMVSPKKMQAYTITALVGTDPKSFVVHTYDTVTIDRITSLLTSKGFHSIVVTPPKGLTLDRKGV